MPPRKFSLSIDEQLRIWRSAKEAAGPRYNSDFNVELEIKGLFDGIGRTDNFFVELEKLKTDLTSAFRDVRSIDTGKYDENAVVQNLPQIKKDGEVFLREVIKLGADKEKKLDLSGIRKKAEKLLRSFNPIDDAVWQFERNESEEQRQKAKDENRPFISHNPSEKLRSLQSLQSSLRKLSRQIRNIESFAGSQKALLFNDPIFMILGRAGMGKTHLVCDIARERLENKYAATIIVLGEKLLKVVDPLESVFAASGLKGSKEEILTALNTVGEKQKCRSLIIVDAINEADRKSWKSGVRKLINDIKRYPWIGLVLTCRTPFENLYLPKGLIITTAYHVGFEENELEAMTEFFNFYGIALPQVPLLISEFSSPLFLTSFCKTARDIRHGKVAIAKDLKDLALGQVGMTKILEDYYLQKEDAIVKKYQETFPDLVKRGWIWKNFGADKNRCLVKSLAIIMANTGLNYVLATEVKLTLKELSENKYSDKQYDELLRVLIEEGTLIRDVSWDGEKKRYFEVIKFSFHKFSDHIIARYLLERYLDPHKVSESLSAANPLGDLFKDRQSVQDRIDIIEALMVEFPQRVKKNPALDEKDLIDFLPSEALKSSAVRSAFISSLYWRRPENFLNSKGEIKKSIRGYINNTLLRFSDSSKELLDLLVSTSTKPFHPLNADRLHAFLSKSSVAERDLFWTEYIRKQSRSGSVHKLVSWIERNNLNEISAEQAGCVFNVLGWALTTNFRSLRNRITRCMYIVGSVHPEKCFDISLELIKANDPYVVERVVAACYGIVMAKASDGSQSKLLSSFAKEIYSAFFKKNASLGTTNVLIRDYARGIIEVALQVKPSILNAKQVARTRPPYKDIGRRRWGRSPDKDKGKYREGNAPLGMDFENYTLGHLARDRGNYDYKHKGFIRIKENVLWRIYDLGYSLERFGDIDREIASFTRFDRNNDDPQKIDRYGKKYSWIAYHELLGLKMDNGDLADWALDQDGRRSEVDIDPSFPEMKEKEPLFREKLTSGPGNIEKWLVQKKSPNISKYLEVQTIDGIEGPWVLVHGHIGQKDALNRRVTTYVTGLLMDSRGSVKLNKHHAINPPRDNEAPSLPEAGGLFLGELGWCEQESEEQQHFIELKKGEKRVRLTKKEKKSLQYRIVIYGREQSEDERVPPDYKDVPIIERIPAQPIARWLSTKNGALLGSEDDGIGLYVPSIRLLKDRELHHKPRTFSFMDSKGCIVVMPVVNGDQFRTHENLLYVQKSYLNQHLSKQRKKLFRVTWGERQYWPEDDTKFSHQYSPIYQDYKNVYREIFPY